MIYLLLFWEFFQIGLFTFGGGYAMIPLIQDAVLSNGWLTESEIVNFIAISESTPGPVAINMATFVGSSQGGFFGAVCATFGVVLPSLVIIIIIAALLRNFSQNRFVKGVISGINPVTIGLIIATGVIIFAGNVFSDFGGFTKLPQIDLRVVIIAALIGALLAFGKFVIKKKISPIMILLFSAICGIIVYAF